MAGLTVSVFTTLYNHEKFIGHALQSALNQTLSPAEVIVIDDASTDDSVRAARAVDHPLIRVFDQKYNLGGANTVRGIGLCKGDFIAILNSDDAWETEKLEKQCRLMSGLPSAGAVFTHIKAVDEDGAQWDSGSHQLQHTFNSRNRTRHEWLRHFFLEGNPFCASSALVRRQCFDGLGTLNGSYIQLQDLDMWIRLTVAGYDLHVIEEPLTYYRVTRNGSNMSTGHAGARATYYFEYAKTLRHFWKLSSLNELMRVFPEMKVHDRADDSLTLFYLARYAAGLPGLHHRLFALETMSEWGGNPEAMKLALECHGFGFSQYRNFFATGPIRQMLNLNIQHQLNRFAMSVMPYAAYQRVKTRIGRFMRNKV
ncbi:MAG: glycosyltransferase family 2 protein [Acidiferrobacterales bacterium]